MKNRERYIEPTMNRRQFMRHAGTAGILVIFPTLVRASENGKGTTMSATGAENASGMKKVVKTTAEWRELLTPEQFHITREKGTERAFSGEYYDLKAKGAYKCVCCGLELFSSEAKFDSGSGWPSFWQAAADHHIREARDDSLFMVRTEVLCARCDAHLGHLFGDGPKPTGLRYCINAAALKFTPVRN